MNHVMNQNSAEVPELEDGNEAESSRYWVKSVGRAIDILELLALDIDGVGMSVTDIASTLHLSKSAAFSTLYTLRIRGLVHDEGNGMTRRYRLGLALARLGTVAAATTNLREVARPHLVDLARKVGATARLAQLSEGHAVVIEQATGNERVRLDLRLGSAETLHTTGLGKAMLAQLPDSEVRALLEKNGLPAHTEKTITDVDEFMKHLDQVRDQGYATNDEEDAEGVFGVASTVFDHTLQCIGAVTITGLIRQQSPQWYFEDMGIAVRDCATKISADLGFPVTATVKV